MSTSTFTGNILQVTIDQMESIQQYFSWSHHPLNPKEIIIEVQEDKVNTLSEIVPNTELSGLIICHY